MKIAHVTYYYNDGTGYQDNLLPQYQEKQGHEVVVITTDLVTPFNNSKAQKDRRKKVGTYIENNVRIVRLSHWWEFKGRFVHFRNLEKTLANEKPDYIFHHGLCASSILTCIKYKMKHPFVFLVADNHADLNISARNRIWKWGYYGVI